MMQLEVALGTMVLRKLPRPKFGGVRTGGRSARVVDQVLVSTVELLGERGYAALRIDDVAMHAGVNKTTVYRRWPTKSQLVAAALHQFHMPQPAPDTGNLERDLIEMFVESSSNVDALATRGVMRMIHAELHDPEVEAILIAARARMNATRRVRLDIAVKRGELPPRTDVTHVLFMMSSAVYSRLLAFTEPPSRAFISDVVCIATAGARSLWAAPRAYRR